MKDIKTFLIGFLICACMFLIMGQGKMGLMANGRYQGFGTADNKYLINTADGALWGGTLDGNSTKWVKIIHEVK